MSKVTVGQRMRGLRINSGKSLDWLAENVFHITKPALHQIEKLDSISTKNLRIASQFYGVSTDWIVNGFEFDSGDNVKRELMELREKLAAIQKILE